MKKPNRLIKEKSPYLLQHAYNPVDWFPWCEEAFEKARKEDKPVFLSIGYSTCHWCHVMEKESFEDEEIARILNENFVSIKVDREERPDIDSVYMSVCQAMTGTGGWPLTIIMTPDRRPFFAGTYFPKEGRYGRPGLKEILLTVAKAWRENREKLEEIASKVAQAVKEEKEPSRGELDEAVIHRTFGELFGSFDSEYGGFGSAPKFPVPHNLMFLMRYYRRTKNQKALDMVRTTLTRMRLGGIWDHVGFGFHRYSTDRYWKLPHFEKMLYDNALLLYTYAEAFRVTGERLFRKTAEEIAEYLTRDMRSPEGVFFSAEDADSEGEEGKFYTWTFEELKAVLSEEEFSLAKRVFSLEEDGNYLEEATREKTGRNILYMSTVPDEGLWRRIEEIREKLFRARENRVRPLRDEKVLTDWNGLAVAGFSRAGVLLGRRDFVDTARKTADFILRNTVKGDRVLHRYKDGTAEIWGFLEDYAYLIWGLTELYFGTFEKTYLDRALELVDHVLKHFRDKGGGFFKTPDYGEEVLVRKREIYDGATPSGNSVMAFNLIRIGRLTGKEDLVKEAERCLESFGGEISLIPSAHTFSVIALDLLVNGTVELKGKGKGVSEDLLRVQREVFVPEGVFSAEEGEDKVFYLCRNYVCESPLKDVSEVLDRIRT
ncbi:MAG: thioredoxin domain-containing protein [Aquificota bacterium]|nr:thioredoxin domain-containing protein [Aquificota bacterium]